MPINTFSLVTTLGPPLLSALVKRWVGEGDLREALFGGLLDWFKENGADVYSARKAANRLEELRDRVLQDLEPLFATEAVGPEPAERIAAALALADALQKVPPDLSSLIDADLNPAVFARRLREAVRDQHRDLGQAGGAFFERLTEEMMKRLVAVADELPTYAPTLAARQLADSRDLSDRVDLAMERLSRIDTQVHRLQPDAADADFELRYRGDVARLLDRVEVFFGSARRVSPYRLTLAYVDVEVERVERAARSRSEDDRPLPPRMGLELGAAAALAGSSAVLLSGPAGSGKTTLLQWLAVRAARDELPGELDSWCGRVPFLMRLRSCDRLPHPENLVELSAPNVAGLMPTGWVHRLLDAGRALLFIDGLDEVQEERRDEVARWMEDLRESWPGLPLVLSTRPLAVRFELALKDLLRVHMRPMRPDQIETFVERWHAAVMEGLSPPDRPDLQACHDALQARLRARGELRRLAETPLMTALLCAINRDLRGNLPESRREVYQEAMLMLLERRDRERAIPSPVWTALVVGKKRALLGAFAWWMVRNDLVEVDQGDAADQLQALLTQQALGTLGLDGPQMLGLLIERSGVLRHPADGRVDFTHKSFLEYLAAQGALDAGDIQMVVQRATRDGWREIAIHLAAMAPQQQAKKVIEGLLNQTTRATRERRLVLVLLAGACVREAAVVRAELQARVKEAVDGLDLPADPDGARAWASVGALAVDHLKRAASAEVDVARWSVLALGRIGGEEGLAALADFVGREEYPITQPLFELGFEFGELGARYRRMVWERMSWEQVWVKARSNTIDIPGARNMVLSSQSIGLLPRLSGTVRRLHVEAHDFRWSYAAADTLDSTPLPTVSEEPLRQALAGLEELRLPITADTTPLIPVLRHLSRLVTLDIYDRHRQPAEDGVSRPLVEVPLPWPSSLQHLELSDVTCLAFDPAGQVQLKSLTLNRCQGDLWERFVDCPALTELSLRGLNGPPPDLSRWERLTSVVVIGCSIPTACHARTLRLGDLPPDQTHQDLDFDSWPRLERLIVPTSLLDDLPPAIRDRYIIETNDDDEVPF